jgi:hypothetical protein
MIRIDESVSVVVNPKGEPIGFRWRGSNYLVSSPPTRWFARREWWVDASRVQRGIGSGVLEVEMWRLSADSSVAGGVQTKCAQYELVHSTLDNHWRLLRIFD